MKQKIILAASILIGLLAAFLSGQYIASKERDLAREKEAFDKQNRRIEVVVLAKALPADTKLTQDDLGILSFPERALRGQVIKPEGNIALRLVGRRLAMGVEARKPLLWSDIEGGAPEAGGLASMLHPKMRAISISVSGAASVSNMVRPTDHVDVLGTFTLPSKKVEGATELVTLTILQDVLVLATGQETALTANAQSGNYGLVTLEVSPHEAEVLTFAEQMRGRLTLSLRNPEDLHYEKELPQVNFERIRTTLEGLNELRQKTILRKR
ncbi:MAG: Flp pilus assembly protein CpaB [Kiritimatiellia bacterium]